MNNFFLLFYFLLDAPLFFLENELKREYLGNLGINWDFMLTGEYSATLDETGRISLPRRLRDILGISNVVLTNGFENCLVLYTVEKWMEQRKTILDKTNQFSAKNRAIRRRIIGPAQEIEIDKQGRIQVPPNQRDYAGLSKDCIVLGQYDYVEIWAEDTYKAYLNDSEEDFLTGSEELGIGINENSGLTRNGD